MTEKKFVDWELIEKHYRAGILSLREIAKEGGVTEGAIRKRAKKDIWTRNLKEKIQQRADDLVRKEAVRAPSTQLSTASEATVVEANAELQYRIRMEHRQDIGRTRNLFKSLLGEVELATQEKGTFEAVIAIMGKIIAAETDDDAKKLMASQFGDLEGDIRKLTSINNRIDSAKKLTEILERLVKMEREAFGIDGDDEKAKSGIDDLLSRIRGIE